LCSKLNRFYIKQAEYFGQYGNILKVVVNTSKPYNPGAGVGPCFSAYVTYSNPKEATLALLVNF